MLQHGLLSIDPHAWMLTLPLLAAWAAIGLQPPHHPLKRLWRRMRQQEAWARAVLLGQSWQPWSASEADALSPFQQRLLYVLLGALAAGTALSLAAFLAN